MNFKEGNRLRKLGSFQKPPREQLQQNGRDVNLMQRTVISNRGEGVCDSGHAEKGETGSNFLEKRKVTAAWGRTRLENDFLGYKLEGE